MDLILIGEQNILDFLSNERTQSPEEFIIILEDALESGELTLDEASILLRDFNNVFSMSPKRPS